MLILGIETSCDETACALVRDGREVLSNVVASQVDIHKVTNGVVPEVAARAHVGQVQAVFEKCKIESKIKGEFWDEVDAIAVTVRPGLLTSLIVGCSFASSLAWIFDKPLIPMNHIKGHIFSNWLGCEKGEIKFPVMVLTVSGGHNDLVLVKSERELEVVGETLDDAAGEAFDKVAKMLGLAYPGGPEISRLALEGDPLEFDLPRPMIDSGDFNFSFSGLKTAVLREVYGLEGDLRYADLAASFQAAAVDVLTTKLVAAAKKYKVAEIHLAGGVSANKVLRAEIASRCGNDFVFRHPKDFNYCTDNAAMIAGAAYFEDKSIWVEPGMSVSPSTDMRVN